MLGLKTQESPNFNRFFQLIQDEADRQGTVFFAFAGDGRDLALPDMEGEDMMGWLIPKDRVAEFQPEWETENSEEALDRWGDFFTWAEWSMEDGTVRIVFNNHT